MSGKDVRWERNWKNTEGFNSHKVQGVYYVTPSTPGVCAELGWSCLQFQTCSWLHIFPQCNRLWIYFESHIIIIIIIIRCQTLLEDLWTIWSCSLYVFYEYYYNIPSYSLGSVFINVYMVLFLFDNVIYVFLLLWLSVLIVCLCLTTLTEAFPCFFLSCKANARVKPAKAGHGPHSS